jgi:choline dehydrogenase-like flavoprotein
VIGDARQVSDGSELEADVCIIGGGAAGITLARELAANHVRCTLLEGGGLSYDAREQALYKGENVGLPYFPLDIARLRYLGGSTNHYGGVCRPFEPEDFERLPWLPDTGWPFGLAELQPYYDRAWEVLRLRTDEFDLDTWLERDPHPDLELPADRIVTRVAQVVPKSRRSLGKAYEDDLRTSSEITLMLNANVVEIETDDDVRTATKVRVATLTGKRFTVTARVFVLAVGGLENPRLLLASNSRRPAGLGNDHDLVGRYFLEHPRFDAAVLFPANSSIDVSFYDIHSVGESELEGYLSVPRDMQREDELVDVQLRLRGVPTNAFEHAERSEDVESLNEIADAIGDGHVPPELGENLSHVVADLMTWQSSTVPGVLVPVPFPEVVGRVLHGNASERKSLVPQVLGDIAGKAYKAVAGTVPLDAVVVTARIDPAPNRDSRVTLGDERDELGMPRIRLDWQLSRTDRESVGRTLDLFASAAGAVGLGRVRRLFDPDGTSWPPDLAGGWHHTGTTRMSDQPASGVVDRNCRVHGMANLFIAGSSVFPAAGSGTPTLTIVALALRLARHLQEQVL